MKISEMSGSVLNTTLTQPNTATLQTQPNARESGELPQVTTYRDEMSLTELSEYLLNEDQELQKKITKSHLAFESLKLEFQELSDTLKDKKTVNPKVLQLIQTGQEFVKQHEMSLTDIRTVTHRLF